MNPIERAVAAILVAALLLPSAAAAQEGGSIRATPGAQPETQGEVRLTFDRRSPADPWAVFGGGPTMTGRAQPGEGIRTVRATGPIPGRSRIARNEAAALAKNRPAARMGAAGQGDSWDNWWSNRPGLLLIAIIGGVIALVLTGHSNEVPWLSHR